VDFPVWRLTPGQALLRYGWDGEYVLYNDLSGDTHLLTATACTLLERLQAAPASHGALALACAIDAGTAESLLIDLEQLSLVEYLPC
jgi:PqqD family protein of HPr-rel-A system